MAFSLLLILAVALWAAIEFCLSPKAELNDTASLSSESHSNGNTIMMRQTNWTNEKFCACCGECKKPYRIAGVVTETKETFVFVYTSDKVHDVCARIRDYVRDPESSMKKHHAVELIKQVVLAAAKDMAEDMAT